MTLHRRLALSAASCLAAATLSHADSTTLYLGRIGFYDTLGYTATDGTQSSQLSALGAISGRFVAGTSTRYSGTTAIGGAAWIYDAQTSATTRAGFYTGDEYTKDDGSQITDIKAVLKDNYAVSTSTRFNRGTSSLGAAASLTNLTTGVATRIGFYSDEFTSTTKLQDTSITDSLGNYVIGTSTRYSDTTRLGAAAWYADVTTGVTTRIGLYDAAYTRTDGTKTSSVTSLTSSGYATGTSRIYTSATEGTAVWLANLTTGATTRVGLYSTEFTKYDTYQYSSPSPTLTESGYLTGTSYRYNGTLTQIGQGAWIANAATGATTRIGLYTGDEFTKLDGTQYSTTSNSTESGYAYGASYRYNKTTTQLGQATWVANAATGTTTRLGFYTGAEYTRLDGTQYSITNKVTESGYAYGASYRYNGTGGQLGQAAWVANAATGVTTRLGFYTSAEYTKADGTQSSTVSGISDSGYAYGTSDAYYLGVATASRHAWVATTDASSITRIGLYGTTEFRATDGTESSSTSGSRSGYIYGTSNRYSGTTQLGQGAWVANAATGATTRIGLYTGEEFIRTDGYQASAISTLNASGYLYGSSNRFSGATDAGNAAWVANAATGATTRVGLTDARHTSSEGKQYSVTTSIINGLYVFGTSTRYNGDTYATGQNAWIFNLATGSQIAIDLSTRPSDNYSYSTIIGITDSGLAFGTYRLFDGETDKGNRAFIWTEDWGTVILDEAFSNQIAQDGWAAFTSVASILPEKLFFGQGTLGSTATSQGIYMAQVAPIPEPATLGLLSLGLATTLLAARRLRA
ncbi:PEP-CTERM protein-sorting domain-containing protein [Terrimicrobium sacchariphilum]|uniref:PEP-CTERM protein-sorting domain-containing protein n=1 Tax=Terrimicrobium sacchariphilum TaxID=690879 RepID=A0A146G4X2_TERSA|nr:PEP-CTERM sorting domain-containing protein [Terrimicrobium sacchariphilum]GAT32462.1 PEP-CTERM protein-sorting domain-containing protein [Terrimicrobium sacchariphilum]